MRRIGSLTLAASMAVPLLALAGCTSAPDAVLSPSASASLAPSGDRVLRLGTVFSSSGTEAATGAAQVAGVEAAVREINEAGGVLGAPVVVFHRDGGDDSTQTLEASIADLSARTVDVVIGPSTTTLAHRAITASGGIPVIATSEIAEPAAGLFTMLASGQTRNTAVVAALGADERSDVAIITSRDDAGDAAVASLSSALDADGASVAAAVSTTGAPKQTQAAAKAVAAAEPDAVVIATAPEAVPAVISALIDAGLSGDRLWTTVPVDLSTTLAPGVAAGIRGVVDDPTADEALAARVRTADPAVTDLGLAAQAYDATIAAALAVTVADDDGSRSIAASLAGVTFGGIPCSSFVECLDVLTTEDDIDYQGRSGPLDLDAAGRPTAGRFTVVEY